MDTARRVTVELDPELFELDPDLDATEPDLVEEQLDLVELDQALLEPEPDAPGARIVASLIRLRSRFGPALISLKRLLLACGHALRHAGDRSHQVAKRWLAAGAASWSPWASGLRRQVLAARARNWWGWPTTARRLSVTAVVAFLLGCVLVLPFALASRRGRAPVGPEPVTAAAPSPARAALPEVPSAPAEELRPSRAQLARQMAVEAFESGQPLEGVMYFRVALRAQRRVDGDDLLIVHTIEALADRQASGAANRLLRALGEDARRLLQETALRHPDPLVRARARRIVRPPAPGGFSRWFR